MSNFSTFSKDLLVTFMIPFYPALYLRDMTIYLQHLILGQPVYRLLIIKASMSFFLGIRFTTVNEYHQHKPKPDVPNSFTIPPAIGVTWRVQSGQMPLQYFFYTEVKRGK